MNVKALNAVAVMLGIVVAGVVILFTSPTFAHIVNSMALVMCVCGTPLLTWMTLRVVLELRRVKTWRPAGSRPFLSARPVPPSLPAGERRAVGTVRGELERGKVTR